MMTSPTEAFFDELAQRGHVSWLEHERGRVRVEVVDAECVRQWTVTFQNGDIEVSQSTGSESDVDVYLRGDRALFDRAVRGETSLLQAAMRGELAFAGSMELLSPMNRLLPGPADQKGPRRVRPVGGDGRERRHG